MLTMLAIFKKKKYISERNLLSVTKGRVLLYFVGNHPCENVDDWSLFQSVSVVVTEG